MAHKPIKVLWFGTGNMTHQLLPCVRKDAVNILAFIDERREFQGKRFRGLPVIGLAEAAQYDYDRLLVGARPFDLIADKLRQAGIAEEKIVPLDFESHILEAASAVSAMTFTRFFTEFLEQYHIEAYIDQKILRHRHWYAQVYQKFHHARVERRAVTVKFYAYGGYGDVLISSAVIKEFYKQAGVPLYIDVIVRYPDVFRGHSYIRNIFDPDFLRLSVSQYDLVWTLDRFLHLKECNVSLEGEHMAGIRDIVRNLSAFAADYSRYLPGKDRHDGGLARLAGLRGWNRWDLLGASKAFSFSRANKAFVRIDPAAQEVLGTYSLENTPYLTVHSGVDVIVRSEYAPKRWPGGHWQAFCRLVKERRPDIRLVQVGAADSPRIDGVDLCLLGKTSMLETTVLLKHALLHVDNESGLVHLRRQLGGQSVVLFGPTPVYCYGYAENVNIPPSKCGDCMWLTDDWYLRCVRDMDVPECMESIRPEQVALATEQALAEIRHYGCALDGMADLYTTAQRQSYDGALAAICQTCGLEQLPVTEHILGECGTYLHASKQWEYPFALSRIMEWGPELTIADVGSGRGVLPWYLASLGHRVTAYDVQFSHILGEAYRHDAEYIRFAAAHGYSAEYGDIFNIPAEDGTFDVVTCISVVEHIPHKRNALKEMLRVLKPGGRLILTYDLMGDDADLEDENRIEVFTPARIQALLREVGITGAVVHVPEEVRHSMRDMTADGVKGMPEGMTVGGFILIKSEHGGRV